MKITKYGVLQIGSDQTPYRWFAKLFCRWDQQAKFLRLGRLVWATGVLGRDKDAYSAALSIALRPVLFGFSRGVVGEWSLTLFGVRIHYKRSYGGWIALAMLMLAALSASPAHADCRQFFVAKHHRQVAVVQQVVAPYYPPVYYAAGQDLQAEALAAKVAALVEKKLALRQEQQSPAPSQSIMAQKCAKCHSGATPKGGITLDGATELLCSQITASIRAVSNDSMPKGGPALTPEQKGALLEELLSLERKEGGP